MGLPHSESQHLSHQGPWKLPLYSTARLSVGSHGLRPLTRSDLGKGTATRVTVCSLHEACWAHIRRQSREEAQGGDSAVRWVRAPALSPLAVGPRIQGPGFLSSARQGTAT